MASEHRRYHGHEWITGKTRTPLPNFKNFQNKCFRTNIETEAANMFSILIYIFSAAYLLRRTNLPAVFRHHVPLTERVVRTKIEINGNVLMRLKSDISLFVHVFTRMFARHEWWKWMFCVQQSPRSHSLAIVHAENKCTGTYLRTTQWHKMACILRHVLQGRRIR